VLALAAVGLIVALNGKPEFSSASRPPRGIASPVVALEMARNVEEVDAILGDAPGPDREAMRLKQYLDFAFIACYVALYLAIAAAFSPYGRGIAIAAAVCGAAAGVFDVVENIGILRIVGVPLRETTQSMTDAIRIPSLSKWTLAFAAITLLAVLLWRTGRRGLRAIALVDFLAAVIGFCGLFDNALLVWAGIPMVAGIVGIGAVALFGRR
jgi:hypothetical protein